MADELKSNLKKLLSIFLFLFAALTVFGSYGPVPGYQPPSLSLGTTLAPTLGWHGLKMDPTGDYHVGSRRYGPVEGRFLSAAPLGHAGAMDLYSFCGADPVNFFDPTGRYGKQMGDVTSYNTPQTGGGSSASDLLANVPDRSGELTLASLGIANPLDQQSDDFIGAYQQTRGDMQRTLMQGYNEVGASSEGNSFEQTVSSLFNAIPILGGLKQWGEMNSGSDYFTGQKIGGNQYLQAAGIILAFTPLALEAAPEEAAFNSEINLASREATQAAPAFKTWNQFQAGTAGQFASRTEAAQAWSAYKDANGIVTGLSRSMAARSDYLKSLTDDWRTPSWQKQWLSQGQVPPGYQVDHITPLSIGGPDTPANMRLQGEDIHAIHHSTGRYRPWEQ